MATTVAAPAGLAEMKDDDWAAVSKLPGNSNCIDCNARYPEWGSVNFGILFCTRCSSGHRSLGSSISRVRSIKMDTWTEEQVKLMKAGGNQSCRGWFAANGISANIRSHKVKYDNETARFYNEILKARAEGAPEPRRLKGRWKQPQEWYWMLAKGEPSTINRQRNSIFQSVTSVASKPDFWLVVYGVSVVGWIVAYIIWRYNV